MTDDALIEKMWKAAEPHNGFPAEMMRAALAVVRREEGWQMIETAPEDEPIDLWCQHPFYGSARFVACQWSGEENGTWLDASGNDLLANGWEPTNWRPLPHPLQPQEIEPCATPP